MTTIQKFNNKGEKSGWSFIQLSQAQANKLIPGQRVSFRVKGKLDNHTIEKTSVLPMGDGSFILPVNGAIRKAIGKQHGDKIKVMLEADKRKVQLSADLVSSLKDDPIAWEYFHTLPKSHQAYFSKWIESAKTSQTKTKRIVIAVVALSQRQGYGEMIRGSKTRPYE